MSAETDFAEGVGEAIEVRRTGPHRWIVLQGWRVHGVLKWSASHGWRGVVRGMEIASSSRDDLVRQATQLANGQLPLGLSGDDPPGTGKLGDGDIAALSD